MLSFVSSRRFGNNPFISRMFQPLGQNQTFTVHARQMMHMLFETCAREEFVVETFDIRQSERMLSHSSNNKWIIVWIILVLVIKPFRAVLNWVSSNQNQSYLSAKFQISQKAQWTNHHHHHPHHHYHHHLFAFMCIIKPCSRIQAREPVRAGHNSIWF